MGTLVNYSYKSLIWTQLKIFTFCGTLPFTSRKWPQIAITKLLGILMAFFPWSIAKTSMYWKTVTIHFEGGDYHMESLITTSFPFLLCLLWKVSTGLLNISFQNRQRQLKFRGDSFFKSYIRLLYYMCDCWLNFVVRAKSTKYACVTWLCCHLFTYHFFPFIYNFYW